MARPANSLPDGIIHYYAAQDPVILIGRFFNLLYQNLCTTSRMQFDG